MSNDRDRLVGQLSHAIKEQVESVIRQAEAIRSVDAKTEFLMSAILIHASTAGALLGMLNGGTGEAYLADAVGALESHFKAAQLAMAEVKHQASSEVRH